MIKKRMNLKIMETKKHEIVIKAQQSNISDEEWD